MHAFPLNTITMDLRQKVKRVRPGANVVQRLKRARSMLAKLQKEASMRLTQMQDIGGCRAVVTTIDEVYALREQYRKSKSLHVLVNEDDYIANPEPSGYRSLHLVYRIQSRGHSQYIKLMFEVQLRTPTPHAWRLLQLHLHPPGRQLSLFPELSDLSGAQAVLVGADSLRSIRESDPNYYLDTQVFLEKVEKFVKRYKRAG